jgi:hypothetical protein
LARDSRELVAEPPPFTEQQVAIISEFVSEYTHKQLATLRAEFGAKLAALEHDSGDKVLDWPRGKHVA